MKKAIIEMLNGNVYEAELDSLYVDLREIVKDLNDDKTKFMSIGKLIFLKDQIWTIGIKEIDIKEAVKVEGEKDE